MSIYQKIIADGDVKPTDFMAGAAGKTVEEPR